ncbi:MULTISPECIES: SusD/RagB family nutrient-binding outer membrane lipoprotein [unclassified Leeuwenhoekiella]|uniref:SusD/RagB family nutrient-binding outer membrane lipoprotein n=1 Tax=unclassified Leeuwenhoekiella TaxID=2615029 RepID=UPI000C3BD74E|nr:MULTISPECIES: SusD/RagB family nutrient-binding outer membrane lipoprotein [unclassified Leeuwenhoekiella]MAW96420.1 SusD/RagB family nutrient-binding outer membrane lipoprotein [Leeuwenhoekiella sp.]MBA81307.1 SusD/RagB family nutrient-binding outer membrane lipoprotein [Leeuwenhoekiella sp.]|tara:strand:+ start:8131 stop:9573 length:1443 start_codon:yes stop_codon:yes gene_type:complete
MKNTIYKILIATLFIVTGCTTDFEELNTNPNAPVSVQPGLLLRQVIYDYGEQMSYEGFAAGDLLSQHRTALDFNLFDRHALKSPQLGGNPWPIFYTNLRDNELLLQQAQSNETFKVYEGPALILKAYMTQGLTDLFGDVPYFEAFNGIDGTVTAAYDAQEDIYLADGGILDNLDKGIAALNAYDGAVTLEGDLFFNGNLSKWVQLANSLKLKALMRISGQEDVAAQIASIYTGGNYIKTNADNAVFDFTASAPNSFRFAQLRAGDFNNFVLSETMDEILTDLDDDRIGTFFRPFANSNSGAFNGLINGINASQTSIEPANYSLAGTIFRENTAQLDANFMTAWETYFLLAEAAQKQYINADAESLYDTGVNLAFEYWSTPLPAGYLTGTAAYNAAGTTPLQQIITQKWISNIINGYEGWVEWRRTGFPEFKPVAASLNDGLIPVRMPYPAEEEALNADNYQAAATATNGNSINSPVWWDN